MEKNTDQLMSLLYSQESLQEYLTANKPELLEPSLPAFLQKLLQQYQVKKNQVIAASHLHQIYGYQIFAGSKKPSRNKLLALAFAFPLNLSDTQRLLCLGGVNQLYPRIKRDAIILFAMKEGLSLLKTDDILFDLGEETIL